MQGDTETKPQALSVVAKGFFGLRVGTSIKEFLEEWKSLTKEDQEEFRAAFTAMGYNIKA